MVNANEHVFIPNEHMVNANEHVFVFKSDMARTRENVVLPLKPLLLAKSGQIGTVGGTGIQRKGAMAQRQELGAGRWEMGGNRTVRFAPSANT